MLYLDTLPPKVLHISVSCGIFKNIFNNTIVVPSFSLPTNATLCQKVVNGMYMEDFDIGEQFNNYLLRLCGRAFYGVVIPLEIFKTTKEADPLIRWTRITFGWYPSLVFDWRMLDRAI